MLQELTQWMTYDLILFDPISHLLQDSDANETSFLTKQEIIVERIDGNKNNIDEIEAFDVKTIILGLILHFNI
jgi:hypothetical protein